MSPVPPVYSFGPFRIDAAERLLRCDGVVVPLTPKAVDTLIALVEARGRLVEKDELMKRLWPDTFVEEANLSNQISLLRKALGDDSAQPRYIETIPRRGYRFTADVMESGASAGQLNTAVPAPTRRQPGRTAAMLAMAGVLASAAAAAIVWNMRSQPPAIPTPLKITRLTMSGQAKHAAIAPDGRYVAYVAMDGEGESLWVRQVASSSQIQVVPTGSGNFVGLTFSPDSNFVYYVVRERERPREGALYKVPTLGSGSAPRRILTNIDSPIAFSPDGTRMAFIVSSEVEGRSSLTIANADGSGARALATRSMPGEFNWAATAPAWVPSGQSIICAAMTTDGQSRYGSVIEVQVADGSQKPITSHRWNQVGRMAWLADGTSFIVAASDRLGANQLWHVSYPLGEARQITNDESKNYIGVSLTADSQHLATVQRDGQATVWLAEPGDAQKPRQITAGKYDGRFGLAWTPDGRIVYHSMESGNDDIWIMNRDGTGRRQLTLDPGVDDRPSVSADGRHIVFASNRTGRFTVWRMDADGGNEKQLTRGPGVDPVVTRDGRWVLYSSSSTGRPTLWKVPIEGGASTQLSDVTAMKPAVTPQEDLIVFRYLDDPGTHGKLAVLRLSDGAIVKVFDTPVEGSAERALRWRGDGITFVKMSGSLANIWSQPMTGGPPQQLTHFEAARIVSHDWSADGRSLVFARGTTNHDVVIIANPAGRQ